MKERDALLPRAPKKSSKGIKKERTCLEGPDGFLSWMVAIANFYINFIVVGLGRMSGILYIVFMKMFDVDRLTASVPFSVQQAARNLFGPLAGLLGQKYGVRAVTIVGGIIGALSAAACFFLTDIKWITVFWGLLFGICTAFTTTLNQVPIDEYFEKYKTTAGGLAFSGGCVGAFFFPVVLEFLISRYGINGTFLVMGAFILNVVPAALFLRSPPWKKHTQVEKVRPTSYSTFNSSEPSEVSKEHTHTEFKSSQLITASLNVSQSKNLNPPFANHSNPPLNFLRGKSEDLNTPRIDFAFLRQNSDYVYLLLSLTISPEFLAEDLMQGAKLTDTEPVVNELEDLYMFLKQSRKPKPPSIELGSVIDELTRSVHIVEITNHTSSNAKRDGENMENNEDPRFRSIEDNPRWLFMATKLGELQENFTKNDILNYFPIHLHNTVAKIQETLKNLNELLVTQSENAILDTEAYSTNNNNNNNNNNDTSTTISKSKSNGALKTVSDTNQLNGTYKSKETESKKSDSEGLSNSFTKHMISAIKLHKNPIFLLISLCRGVFMLTFIPMVTIIVDFAIDNGLHRDTGKYVIAILSLGDLVGRLCLGWITDSGFMSFPVYMVVGMVMLGVSTASLPMMHSELSFMPAVLVFGMLQGSLFIRHQVLVSMYMGEHEQTIGMGFINLPSGILGFILPYYIGYFRDTLGSYNIMFYINGAICALVGLIWLFEPCLRRFTPADQRQKLHESK